MKVIRAQFRPGGRPGRRAVAVLGALAVAAAGAVGVAAWQRGRVDALQHRLADLEEEQRTGLRPPPPPLAVYTANAESMLRERGAAWTPMLRTLESAAMIGVTPTLVEFNAIDGNARAELAYTDPAALFDYLARLDEGLAPGETVGRWSLVQLRVQAATAAPGGMPAGDAGAGTATASIQSNWSP